VNDKFGVRIYPLQGKVILVKQTVKKNGASDYVIDTMANGDHREAHVNINNDKDIAEAVRQALKGILKRSV
jgi:hypothetical protein